MISTLALSAALVLGNGDSKTPTVLEDGKFYFVERAELRYKLKEWRRLYDIKSGHTFSLCFLSTDSQPKAEFERDSKDLYNKAENEGRAKNYNVLLVKNTPVPDVESCLEGRYYSVRPKKK